MTRLKLEVVSLAGFEDLKPAELSGGMTKRAALARAIVMDPELLFCDEPSAGLDPVVAASIDDLILRLRDAMGMSIVVVTHDLDSIFAIGGKAVYLDVAAKTMTAIGDPKKMLEETTDDNLRHFLTRGRR